MSFKFVHAADIHLDSPLRGLERYEGAPAAELRLATRQAFVELVTYCVENKVAFLLLAGDIYDGDWKDYNTGLFFQKQMTRLRDAEIPVYIVHGNHDAENKMTRSLKSLKDLGNVNVFPSKRAETKSVGALDVAIHGRSYGEGEINEDLSADYPKAVAGALNIGLLHTSADGRSAEHKRYAPCTIQGLVDKGYDYWALGHVHRREVLKSEPYIVFPGNLQGRHIREDGPKGATIVSVSGTSIVSVEHRDFDTMRWHYCDVPVAGLDSAEQVVDRVSHELGTLRKRTPRIPLAVRVRLHGTAEAHGALVAKPDHWIAEIRAQGTNQLDTWIEKVLFETRAPIDLDALRSQANPLGELLRAIDAARRDPAAIAAIAAMLQPVDNKLPVNPSMGMEPIDLTSDAAIARLIDEAEQILVPALFETGEAA